jgi:hypothetical protein
MIARVSLLPEPQTELLPILQEMADGAEHQAKEIRRYSSGGMSMRALVPTSSSR